MKVLNIFFGKRSRSDSALKSSAPLSVDTVKDQRDYIPSFCFTVLKVSGPRLKLEEFRKAVSGFDPTISSMPARDLNHFCLNSIAPIDQSFFELNRISIIQELRLKIWGTSTDASGVTLKESAHQLRYSFSTAESPPTLVLQRLIKRFPELKFSISFQNDRTRIQGVMQSRRGQLLTWQQSKFKTESYSKKCSA